MVFFPATEGTFGTVFKGTYQMQDDIIPVNIHSDDGEPKNKVSYILIPLKKHPGSEQD